MSWPPLPMYASCPVFLGPRPEVQRVPVAVWKVRACQQSVVVDPSIHELEAPLAVKAPDPRFRLERRPLQWIPTPFVDQFGQVRSLAMHFPLASSRIAAGLSPGAFPKGVLKEAAARPSTLRLRSGQASSERAVSHSAHGEPVEPGAATSVCQPGLELGQRGGGASQVRVVDYEAKL